MGIFRYCVFLFAIFYKLNANCQIYSAEFECTLEINIGDKDEDTSVNGVSSIHKIPLSTKILYKLTADKNYIILEGKITESTLFPGADISIKEENAKIIIDLKRLIAYFPNEKIYKKVIEYKLKGKCLPDINCKDSLNKLGISTEVKFSSKFPWFVTPGIIFSSDYHIGAILFLKTNNFEIKVKKISFKGNGRLKYENVFFAFNDSLLRGKFGFFE